LDFGCGYEYGYATYRILCEISLDKSFEGFKRMYSLVGSNLAVYKGRITSLSYYNGYTIIKMGVYPSGV
jgi:hypothetical protein